MVARHFFARMAAPSSARLILMGGGLSLVSVIVFAGLTAYPMQMIPLALVFWMGIALLASQMKVSSFMLINLRTPKMIVGIILLLLAPVFFGYAYVRGNAYAEWKKMEGISLDQKAYFFKKLYPALKDNAEFLRQYGSFLMEQNDLNQALLYLKEAILRNPAPIHYYALADCYADLKKFPEAIATVHVVKKGIPNLMRPRHVEANYTLFSGDSVKFLNLAQDALDFEPKINNPEVMEMKQELRTQMQKVLAK
jgi:tetratricopeptide (TPR) repeat protein